ncbi:MAG: bifunctional folylpolyglutamate synthase/dihydrofolate synthase [Methanobacteriota archaeon]
MERLLARLGDPHGELRAIHVGGTNGKGSVSAFAASILEAAGHRTGLYTSPHVVRFSERIQVDGTDIGARALARATDEVLREARRVPGGVTYFEAATAVAFLHFARSRIDAAVVEVGLGGRLDATNVLERPLATVVTNVGHDHEEILGPTLADIAREKAGILKDGVPAATGATGGPLSVLRGAASRCCAPLFVHDEHFSGTYGQGARGKACTVRGLDGTYRGLRPRLAGRHQAENAALAIVACELSARQGIRVPQSAVRKGVAAATLPGRLQWMPGRPRTLVDGGHNEEAWQVLVEFLRRERFDRLHMVCGILADKDPEAFAKALGPLVDRVTTTTPASSRALPASRFALILRRHGIDATPVDPPRTAIRSARAAAATRDLVVVSGSFYLAGEAIRALATKRPP